MAETLDTVLTNLRDASAGLRAQCVALASAPGPVDTAQSCLSFAKDLDEKILQVESLKKRIDAPPAK